MQPVRAFRPRDTRVSAQIIDGKANRLGPAGASRTRKRAAWRPRIGIVPGLATVLVGDDPASAVYVGAKKSAAHEVGFRPSTSAIRHTVRSRLSWIKSRH
jgi:5,10-methylene-tetrahydrofolate dehydrogenase/methenyl tetrahydrofolate cyclohydrolase